MIERALRNEPDALASLLQHHYAFLYKYILKITMNRIMAEDLVQETMAKAIERLGAFQGKGKFSTWLISIGTRLYWDAMRRRQRERRWLQSEQESQMRALRFEMQTGYGEWPAALEALGQLSYEMRVPVLLKHYYGYEYDEIAHWLGIPAGTVKSRVHNGLKQLRKELQRDG